jgi:polar amino acid transport system permease protein
MPPMTSNIVSLIKTSSQAALVAVADIMYGATQIMLETFRNLEVMVFIWLIYLAIASVAVLAVRRLAAAVRMPGYGS